MKKTRKTQADESASMDKGTPLAVNSSQFLSDPAEFPETAKNEIHKYYEWHHDPDILTLLLRIQPHHESAVKCKTDTAALSYRPHVNNRYFESWMWAKMLNDAMVNLRSQAREEPLKARDCLREIQEIRAELEANEDRLEDVTRFHDFLPTKAIRGAIYDFCYLANSFLRLFRDRDSSDVSKIRHLFARSMRVGFQKSPYKQVFDGQVKSKFTRFNVIHSKDGGAESGIYGTPSYLGSKASSVLHQSYEQLTYRFLKNGAHLGHAFIFNVGFSDWNKDEKKSATEEMIKQQIKDATGLGNGSNWYLNLGGITDEQGKPVKIEDVVVIKSFAELLGKIHLSKETSQTLRDNILSAHRIPPPIMSVVLDGKTTADIDKHVKLYSLNIVSPIHQTFREDINSKLPPDRWIDFDPYHIF